MSRPTLPDAIAQLAGEVIIKVPFHDADPAGIVWHGHYAKYLEIARCALLEKVDYSYDRMADSGFLWPVIDMHLRYVKPARFNQELRVRAWFVEWEYRLKLGYLVTDAHSGLRLCKASTVQVAVSLATGEMCLRSPDVLFERLGVQ